MHDAQLGAEETIRNAESRMGSAGYHLVRNNCEHFAAWCCTGRAASSQVRRWMLAAQGTVASLVAVQSLGAHLALLGGLAFGSIAMIFTALLPSIEVFNLPTFLFVTPMFLFGGTFFSTEELPGWARTLARGLPLTHLAEATRAFALGRLTEGILWNVAYLAVFSAVCVPVALRLMRRRLID